VITNADFLNNKDFKVIVNTGLNKFPMQQTAEMLFRGDRLDSIVGGWMLAESSKLKGLMLSSKKGRRILNRIRGIDNARLIKSSITAEICAQLARIFQRSKRFYFLGNLLWSLAFGLVDRLACRCIRNSSALTHLIYHCRSGFGHHSIKLSKSLGVPVVVEHTIAHQNFLSQIEKSSGMRKLTEERLLKRVSADCEMADLILVPSTWVRDTFPIHLLSKIMVLAPPIDSNFVKTTELMLSDKRERRGVVFIGACSYRKNIDFVEKVIQLLPRDIRVTIVGSWDPNCLHIRKSLLNRENISLISSLPHEQIARLLVDSAVLFFPSRAEGRARVVDEAIYAECEVFCTFAAAGLSDDFVNLLDDKSERQVVKEIVNSCKNPGSNAKKKKKAKRKLVSDDTNYQLRLYMAYQEAITKI